MNEFLLILITLSITGSLLFLIVQVANFFLKEYGSRVQYLLMKITVAIYVLPIPLYSATLIWGNFWSYKRDSLLEDFSYSYHIGGERILDNNVELVSSVVFFTWLIGFVFFWIFIIWKEYIILKEIIHNSVESKDCNLYNILEPIKNELRIKKEILLLTTDVIATPFTTGIKKIIIVLPQKKISEKECYFILKHELCHYKSKDLLFKLLIGFIKGIHWYNPVIVFFAKKFYDFGELACDELATKDACKEDRIIYVKLLLSLSKGSRIENQVMPLTSHNELLMKRRVISIMEKKHLKNRFAVAIVTILFISVCPVISYAASEGMLSTQSKLATLLKKNSSEEILTDNDSFQEYTEECSLNSNKKIIEMNMAKGTNMIDTIIEYDAEIQFSPLSLNNGASIRLVLFSDNASDSFRAGIINKSSGYRKYVSSSNGAVSYIFNITSAANYIVYVENMSNNNIHVSGGIYVNY